MKTYFLLIRNHSACKMVKVLTINHDSHIESIVRYALLHGNKEKPRKFKSRNGCIKRSKWWPYPSFFVQFAKNKGLTFLTNHLLKQWKSFLNTPFYSQWFSSTNNGGISMMAVNRALCLMVHSTWAWYHIISLWSFTLFA